MGASSDALAAVGMPVAQAMIVGVEIGATTLTGTTQGTAAALQGSLCVVTAAASQTGGLLSALVNKGRTREVVNTSSTDAVIYPPVGSSINGLSANTGVTVPANKSAVFTCIAVTNGKSVYSALVSA